ncbi:MAG: SDR family NAD(P)-dependent oxidoreductase [Acidobacteria bacterium]|nr:MAG: SDR family NAD(P)-dependent oxidoreductase [Acidobacteriota bacterium]REK04409.1 MAG: SDR family NAD(P)-dependent oxidoreductase [Acidobacteriota bacterium]
MRKILVLGAGGLLGHHVCGRGATRHHVFGTLRGSGPERSRLERVLPQVELLESVDVLDESRLLGVLDAVEPDAIVNCVGIVKQRAEAEDPCLCIAINSLLPHRLARWAADHGARLVHIGTDCVFDGRRGGYLEMDVPNATDLYGRTKALGDTLPWEEAAITLRTSFVGRELGRRRHGLLEWFFENEGGRVRGFSRAIYSGLTALELAGVVLDVIEHHPDLRGLYHLASEPISKDALLRLVREVFDLDIEIESVEEPQIDLSLRMDRFTAATGYSAPSWRTMLERLRHESTCAPAAAHGRSA